METGNRPVCVGGLWRGTGELLGVVIRCRGVVRLVHVDEGVFPLGDEEAMQHEDS